MSEIIEKTQSTPQDAEQAALARFQHLVLCDPKAMSEWFKKEAKRFDTEANVFVHDGDASRNNPDGRLCMSELDSAIKNQKLNRADKDMLIGLRDNYAVLCDMVIDDKSRKDNYCQTIDGRERGISLSDLEMTAKLASGEATAHKFACETVREVTSLLAKRYPATTTLAGGLFAWKCAQEALFIAPAVAATSTAIAGTAALNAALGAGVFVGGLVAVPYMNTYCIKKPWVDDKVELLKRAKLML